MTLQIGPNYASAVAYYGSYVTYPERALGAENSQYARVSNTLDGSSNMGVNGFALNVPEGATIVSVSVDIRGQAVYGYGDSVRAIAVYWAGSKYITLIQGVVQWHTVTWIPSEFYDPNPEYMRTQLNSMGVGIDIGNYDPKYADIDAVRVTVQYTMPAQSISPLPVVVKLKDPLQAASKVDPSDPVTYTNEVRGGELITKARVNAVRFGAQPTLDLSVGTLWISDADNSVRVWDGTIWKYLAQPDSLLLATMLARQCSAETWQTVLGLELDSVPSTWGFSWLVVGLTSGANARVRINQDDVKVWSLTDHQTFGYFESAGVYGVERLANSTIDNVQATTFTMPSAITAIELQMRRIDGSTVNQVSLFSLWAHPR